MNLCHAAVIASQDINWRSLSCVYIYIFLKSGVVVQIKHNNEFIIISFQFRKINETSERYYIRPPAFMKVASMIDIIQITSPLCMC